eukprot:TRINITY_DN3811_c0_g1_i14.p3 TRINITY_DN3811_c0_g1~~TRINITY_DN3811_c0_g1_i14.p3  ORF type:complete len:181 (-),score=17.41 TRINITY_DN3811_c0_g1_i14:1309-1851(-)
MIFFFLMIRRPPRSTQGVSSAASDVYKRQVSTQSTWAVVLLATAPEYTCKPPREFTVVEVATAPEERIIAPQVSITLETTLPPPHTVSPPAQPIVVLLAVAPLPIPRQPPWLTVVSLTVAPETHVLCVDTPAEKADQRKEERPDFQLVKQQHHCKKENQNSNKKVQKKLIIGNFIQSIPE